MSALKISPKGATGHRLGRKAKWLPLMLIVAAAVVSCAENFEERCRRECREYTEKQCPRQLDECTRLDSMVFMETPTGFCYCYSVSGILDNDSIYADDAQVQKFREALVQNVRADIGLRQCKEHGFIFTYAYVSESTGKELMRHIILPSDYQ